MVTLSRLPELLPYRITFIEALKQGARGAIATYF
jgi:hypothetical protein